MSACAEFGCETPSTTLVQVAVSEEMQTVGGVMLRFRRFCDDHKPAPGTVLPS